MRLWSLHPEYLDQKGLVALWREGLLAQAVINGRTRGYTRHPQLSRFLEVENPGAQIAAYLRAVHAEATRRNYNFDSSKLGAPEEAKQLLVTRGQLDYEWLHLCRKLATRAPAWREELGNVQNPRPHPMFDVIDGEIAAWEVVTTTTR